MNIELQSMAIDLPPVAAHPNRVPFRGVLTLVDTPSDRAPAGANGHRVLLTRAAAEQALPSLLGMGLDYAPSLDRHDARRKVGIITEANIVEDQVAQGGTCPERMRGSPAIKRTADKPALAAEGRTSGAKAQSLCRTAIAGLKARSTRTPLVASRQQVPGFQVAEIAVLALVGVKKDGVPGPLYSGSGNDVPEVFGDDVEGEEIDLVGGIAFHLPSRRPRDCVAHVRLARFPGGGFHLHTVEYAVGFHNEIVAGGIAPGFGDGEPVGGGAGHELQLDPLAAPLGVANHSCHGSN